MGEKKEAFILKSLEERARSTGRRLMAESHETAAALADGAPRARPRRRHLAGRQPAARLRDMRRPRHPRRRRPADADGCVHRLQAGRTALAHGDTKSSVLLWGGFQADLRLVPRDSLGAALQYFTGSKPHNIALRDRAIKRGFKLNEYGLFRNDDGQLVAGASEEDIYRALGLASSRPSCARIAARSRPRSAARCRAADSRRPARRSPHAHDGNRRSRRRRDHGARCASRRPVATSPSPITARRWRWPTASTSGARSSTRAVSVS